MSHYTHTAVIPKADDPMRVHVHGGNGAGWIGAVEVGSALTIQSNDPAGLFRLAAALNEAAVELEGVA